MFLIVRLGERRCCGKSILGVVVASENIVLRRVNSLKWDSWRWWGRWPFIAVMRVPAALMMTSRRSGLKDIYVCGKRWLTLGLLGCISSKSSTLGSLQKRCQGRIHFYSVQKRFHYNGILGGGGLGGP